MRGKFPLKNHPASLGDFFYGTIAGRSSEKVVYVLHIFRVNKICFIVLFLPLAERIKMVSIFTFPHRINIGFAALGPVVVPCGYRLCMG